MKEISALNETAKALPKPKVACGRSRCQQQPRRFSQSPALVRPQRPRALATPSRPAAAHPRVASNPVLGPYSQRQASAVVENSADARRLDHREHGVAGNSANGDTYSDTCRKMPYRPASEGARNGLISLKNLVGDAGFEPATR